MSVLSHELRTSLIIVFVITVFYLFVAAGGVPVTTSPFGYIFGITGFLLMLGAKVLYTWRKSQKTGVRGKVSTWLQAHIIIGIVGPYMILLHSAWRLNGVAGIAMLLAFLMVASGFLLNYIYPALPRNVEGAELTLPEIEAQIKEANSSLHAWEAQHPEAIALLGERLDALNQPVPPGDERSVLGRGIERWKYMQQVRLELNQLKAAGVGQAGELGQLLDRRHRLVTQINSLAAARKLLGQARTIHLAVGGVLFALVIVHIITALYYAVLAR